MPNEPINESHDAGEPAPSAPAPDGPPAAAEGGHGPSSQALFPTFGRAAGECRRWRRWAGWRPLSKVFLVTVLAAVLLDVDLTLYYGWKTRTKLAELKADGYLIDHAKGVPKPVAASQNAAPLYMKAADLLEGRLKARSAAGETEGAPAQDSFADADWSRPAVIAQMKRFFAANADVLALCERASRKPKCRFDIDWSVPLAVMLPQMAKMRDLARFVCGAAVEASATGDPSAALRRLRAGYAMDGQLLGEKMSLIDQLCAQAMDAMLDRAAVYVVSRGALPADGARALARTLTGTDFMAPYEHAMNMEMDTGIWTFGQVLKGAKGCRMAGFLASGDASNPSPIVRLIGWLYPIVFRPLIYGDELVYLSGMQKVLAASKLPWREARDRLVRLERARDDFPPWAVVSSVFYMCIPRAVQKRDTTMAQRALLVTALGLRVYRQQHGGAYPASLAVLKAALPWVDTQDVYGGKSLVYRRTGATFVLYSLGPDCRDDGGRMTALQRAQIGEAPRHQQEESAPDVRGVSARDLGDLLWLPESRYHHPTHR